MSSLWFVADIVCPVCKTPLPSEGEEVRQCASGCSEVGYSERGVLYAMPTASTLQSSMDALMGPWEQVQEQGNELYEEEPEQNLAIEGNPREELYHIFRSLSGLSGKVLDIGCGPAGHVPAYLVDAELRVGIDPYEGRPNKEIPFCQALAEFLPFPDGYFDHATMNSVLDHFIDAKVAVAEAMRVIAPEGKLHIYVNISWRPQRIKRLIKKLIPGPLLDLVQARHGESDAARRGHEVPDGAEDHYHVEFFNEQKVRALVSGLGLKVTKFEPVSKHGRNLGFFTIAR